MAEQDRAEQDRAEQDRAEQNRATEALSNRKRTHAWIPTGRIMRQRRSTEVHFWIECRLKARVGRVGIRGAAELRLRESMQSRGIHVIVRSDWKESRQKKRRYGQHSLRQTVCQTEFRRVDRKIRSGGGINEGNKRYGLRRQKIKRGSFAHCMRKILYSPPCYLLVCVCDLPVINLIWLSFLRSRPRANETTCLSQGVRVSGLDRASDASNGAKSGRPCGALPLNLYV